MTRRPIVTLANDERIVSFGSLPPLPDGWCVIRLESGHYIASNGCIETCITVNRYDARTWAFDLARQVPK